MSEEVFESYTTYYDLLYREKDYVGEAAYIEGILRAADPSCRNVLEFGSGTGRHGRLLAHAGFHVLGVERSDSMVRLSREPTSVARSDGDHGSFECVQGDLREASVDRAFDAVISLFHVLSYQTSNDEVARGFANAARHLRPNGIFFFDVWHGPAVLRQVPEVRIKRVEDESVRLIRIAEPALNTNESLVRVRYTIVAQSTTDNSSRIFQEEHLMRYFFPTEIELLAAGAGFEIERSEEFLTGNVPSEDTWGVAYILRKST